MLVSKSSTDLDGISTKLLKAIRPEIEAPLAYIFNLSLTTGDFTLKLKASKVIPIHKSGDPTNCDNYRHITLVNAFSKILTIYLETTLSTSTSMAFKNSNLLNMHYSTYSILHLLLSTITNTV
jgi:hypothetical protein